VSAALRKYQCDLEPTIKAFRDKLDAQKVSDTIYHYTDDRGLAGILGRGKLWLTYIFNLNDPSELRHAFDKAIGESAFTDFAHRVAVASVSILGERPRGAIVCASAWRRRDLSESSHSHTARTWARFPFGLDFFALCEV
jgi:hypothetical protein